MECFGCNKQIDKNDCCVCVNCHKKMCGDCARKNGFICESCGGNVEYLS